MTGGPTDGPTLPDSSRVALSPAAVHSGTPTTCPACRLLPPPGRSVVTCIVCRGFQRQKVHWVAVGDRLKAQACEALLRNHLAGPMHREGA